MNERMLALYRQAFVPHTTTCPDNNMPYETVLFSTEKFAQLIVRECADMVDRAISDGGVDGRILKEHFGVEE